MKKFLFLTLVLGTSIFALQAQDDMYFVPKKSKTVKAHSSFERFDELPVYHTGSSRSIDDYNHRNSSDALTTDSVSDIISFDEEMGVYPDSTHEDFLYTKKMTRWDGYTPTDAYWEGYSQGQHDSWSFRSWHSPWYYSSFYPWYDYTWYDYWYYPAWSWHYGWYSPWYLDRWSWGWGGYYSSWYYYHPWYYGWYGGVNHNWGRGHYGNYRSVAHGSAYNSYSHSVGTRRTTTSTTAGSRGT